ncbi:GNAT family N-acetyltransferase [Cyanobium sp. WAJ14-Wanaka]|uniref:GNAT family N-acetyltransferase n=1 Tax=Cyanobium sp. WAJ14-Wanaka TaxID=2823725 RepID=UPI0020CF3391|nr:GNAT family N-acetyltransferase [Cyanobium sp. WAJ14-Wanaka]MCP9774991.1 GNAT family N-acetyltransferase [Cyanobium sp. WAJ14-Wanaka]
MDLLRTLNLNDRDEIALVYADAVRSQASALYTAEQVEAWANHAWQDGGFDQALLAGQGLASLSSATSNASIEAFGVLDPIDRLSLLYCRGRSCRQGRSGQLLEGLGQLARKGGCRQLRTEASQLSRPLLLRQGWQVEQEEEVLFAGTAFVRWRMIKFL